MADAIPQNSKVAIYARVSTEEQREGQTIDSQISELERFAAERRWIVVGIYQDAGWSGGIAARPDLDRLRDDAAKNAFAAVLINDVDRLARDVTLLGVVKRDLERHGVQVIFRKLPSENSPTHNLMVNILGSFAEFERELISDRTRRGRRHKIEVRKEYLGSLTSYGYRYTPINHAAGATGFIELIPEEAAVVRQMFDWVASGRLSAHAVIKQLNAAKISPRKGGRSWGKSSVLRILHNEMYTGVWHYNKFEACEPKTHRSEKRYRRTPKSSVRQRPRNEWLPLELPQFLRLITREQWEQVQSQLVKNTAFSARNEKHRYLLKSLVVCGGCGGRMVGDPGHGHFSYRCMTRCKRIPSIAEERLNDAIWTALSNLLLKPSLIAEHAEKYREKIAVDAKISITETSAAEAAIDQIGAEESRLLEAYRLGVLSPALLGAELEKLNSRKQSLQLRRVQPGNGPSKPSAKDTGKSITEYCARVAQNLNNFGFEEKQELLRTLVSEIRFTGNEARVRVHMPDPTKSASSNGPIERSPENDGDLTKRMDGVGTSDVRLGRGEIATMEVSLPELNLALEFEFTVPIPPYIIPPKQRDRWGRFWTWRRLQLPAPPAKLFLPSAPKRNLLTAPNSRG
jgi:site-specific DNA recombinase